jgi:hypothetical protein
MDHIRDFYYYKDTSNIHEAEANLIILAKRCLDLRDNSVYFNKKGEVIPEILTAIFAIQQYRRATSRGEKQWFDL